MATGKNFWFKFEWDKWLSDRELHRCSFETRGFWIECIALMEEAETWFLAGTITEIANLVGCSPALAKRCIDDLERNNAACIEREKIQKTSKSQDFVKVVSRRLLKRYNLKEYNKLAKRKERENKKVKTMSNALSKDKSLRVLEIKKEEKREEEEGPPPAPRKSPVKLPTRIPEPFGLTPERWAWLAENIPDLDDPNGAHANFVEYWTNETGPKGEKLNWELTWQKGMRLAKKWQEEDKQNGANSKRIGPDRRTDAEILRDSAQQIASKYSD